MQDRFLTRHRKLVGGCLIALAVFTCLYAAVVSVSDGVGSAVPAILVACLFCFNCVGFFTGWLFRGGR